MKIKFKIMLFGLAALLGVTILSCSNPTSTPETTPPPAKTDQEKEPSPNPQIPDVDVPDVLPDIDISDLNPYIDIKIIKKSYNGSDIEKSYRAKKKEPLTLTKEMLCTEERITGLLFDHFSYFDKDNKEIFVKEGDVIRESVTISAIYKEGYFIYYDSCDSNSKKSELFVEKNELGTVKINNPDFINDYSDSGKRLLGWSTEKYNKDKIIPINNTPQFNNQNIRLYAIWEYYNEKSLSQDITATNQKDEYRCYYLNPTDNNTFEKIGQSLCKTESFNNKTVIIDLSAVTYNLILSKNVFPEPCTIMRQLIFPKTLDKIDNGAFANCEKLISIIIPTENQKYRTYPPENYTESIFLKDDSFTLLEVLPYVYEITTDHKRISSLAFKNVKLKNNEYRLDPSTEFIEKGAFEGCKFDNIRIYDEPFRKFQVGQEDKYVVLYSEYKSTDNLDKFNVDGQKLNFKAITEASGDLIRTDKSLTFSEFYDHMGSLYHTSSKTTLTFNNTDNPVTLEQLKLLANRIYELNNINDKFGVEHNLVIDLSGCTFTEIPEGTFAYKDSSGKYQSICGSSYQSIYLDKVILPQTIKTIGSYAFYKNKLSYLNIPKSVTTIGECALFQAFRITSSLFGNLVFEEKNTNWTRKDSKFWFSPANDPQEAAKQFDSENSALEKVQN